MWGLEVFWFGILEYDEGLLCFSWLIISKQDLYRVYNALYKKEKNIVKNLFKNIGA